MITIGRIVHFGGIVSGDRERDWLPAIVYGVDEDAQTVDLVVFAGADTPRATGTLVKVGVPNIADAGDGICWSWPVREDQEVEEGEVPHDDAEATTEEPEEHKGDNGSPEEEPAAHVGEQG